RKKNKASIEFKTPKSDWIEGVWLTNQYVGGFLSESREFNCERLKRVQGKT
mgnify:CR=1